jgi:glycine/D-amino acid oxidase-like deaminating enzyme
MAGADAVDSVDVLIVGGGVLGAATAYHLARRGADVLVVERGALNREASGANAGTLHIQIPAFHFRTHYLGNLAAERAADLQATNQFYIAAARAWSGLEDELQADLGVRQVGGLMVAETEDDVRVLCDKSAYECSVGLRSEVLTGAQLRAREPSLGPTILGASYCADEGFANPLVVAPAYMRRAQALGARLRLHTHVSEIEPARAGEFLVDTSSGPVQARRIVLAAGAQTRQVTALVGLDLPVLPHPLQVMVTSPRPPLLRHLIQHAGSRHLSLRQTQFGTFLIGGGWPAMEHIEPRSSSRIQVTYRSLVGNATVATDVVPALRDVPLIRAWAGMTTATGRWNRVGFIGQDRRLGPGKFFVVVAGGWGFTLSPVLGRAISELVLDGDSQLDLRPFGLERAVARM